jgi:hypothetical protein
MLVGERGKEIGLWCAMLVSLAASLVPLVRALAIDAAETLRT